MPDFATLAAGLDRIKTGVTTLVTTNAALTAQVASLEAQLAATVPPPAPLVTQEQLDAAIAEADAVGAQLLPA